MSRTIQILMLTVSALAALPASAAGSTAEHNKRVVLEFYEKALNQHDFAAASALLGPHYIQHNPGAADGAEGLRKFLQLLNEKYPNSHSEIKRVFADADYVILHVHAIREPGTRGFAIMDIFRLESGKIVEHWDVRQEVPDNDNTANSNGMF